jgi:hypothetical protein
MATILKDERSKRHNEYAGLRIEILDHYRVLALVGKTPGAKEHRLPPKLGHWNERHSDLVRAVDPWLWPVVDRIEELRAERDPELIKAQRTPMQRGKNFGRKGKGRARVQTNPGEWPPIYK